MGNSLQWLNDLAQWFGKLIPRVTVIPKTHRGVLFTMRGDAVERRPGVAVWWPIVQRLSPIPVTVRSMECNSCALPMEDSEAIVPRIAICGLSIQYRVVDAVRAATSALDLHALVDNRAQALILPAWDGNTELLQARISEAVRDGNEELVNRFGVRIEKADIVNLGIGVFMLRSQSYSYSDGTIGFVRDTNWDGSSN